MKATAIIAIAAIANSKRRLISPCLAPSKACPTALGSPATMLEKISELRKTIVERNLDIDIEVDGGIKANWTISQCCAAGANCFIAGSGMFAYPTLKEGCDDLRKVAQEAQAGQVLKTPA